MGALVITGLCVMLATAPPAGGPARTGPLTVMEDAISLEHGAEGLVVKLPVHTNALTPTVTLKATVALVDAGGEVRAEQEALSTVDSGPAAVSVTLDGPPDTEDLSDFRLDYRVRCLHPPSEVRGTVELRDVTAELGGGSARSRALAVLEEGIEVERTDEAVEVSLPVHVNALAPSVTLNVLVELIDPSGEPRARSEIIHTMPTGPATVGVTLKTDVRAEELREFSLRYHVKTPFPPADASGEVPLDGMISEISGGMSRPGVLRVLKDAISLRRVDAGLEAAIPVHTQALTQSVTVKVTTELLDVDDTIVAATESSTSMPPGPGTVVALLPTAAETGDLLPLRLRYRVRSLHPPGEESGMIAVSELLAVPEIILMGEDTYLSGSRASVRVLALDHSSMLPLEGSTIRVTLTGEQGKTMPLFEGRINEAGTVEPVVELPAGLEGRYTLRVEAETPLGTQEIERAIQVEARSLPLLVTDKPTYQPGQTIFARILCLRRPTREALAGAEAELRIEDPKGNVVFRKHFVLDSMGVGASEFRLADHVTLGRYVVKATVGRESVEKTIHVERYVLPKFDIELSTDRAHYQPGQELKGRLEATYFFGKPVTGGRLLVTLSKSDVGPEVFQEIRGTLDENGTFSFTAQLPTYFAGIPLEQGDAYVELEVSVTDGADHEERARRTYPVTKAPLVLRVLPESAELVAGVANTIHVAVSYPDGEPVSGTVSVVAGEERFWVETDELGLASFELTIEPNTSVPLVLLATDQKGQKAGAEYLLSPANLEAALLLRPAPSLGTVGKPLTFHLFSTAPSRVAYVDLIKDGQTVLTRSLPMDAGRGVLEFVPGADLSGTVWAHAYQVVSTGDMIRDTRVVYVDPASDLTVDVGTDEDRYAPGSAGTITFSVLDAGGDPTQAALGVTVVDEAVFARTEMRPGMEKVYFTLEDEIMEPRFEIHGFDAPMLVMRRPPVDEARRSLWHKRERAAEVLFASLPGPGSHAVEVNTFREAMEALRVVFLETMDRDWQEIWRARQEHLRSRRRMPIDLAQLVAGGFLDPGAALDMWDQPYTWRADDEGPWFELQSAGPDGVWGTDDDLACEGEQRVRRRFKVTGQVVGAIPKAPGAPDELGIEDFKAAPRDVAAATVEEPRVREYFPETMLFEPMLMTDGGGRATMDVRWPDSITEWRLTTTASTARGELGSDVRGIEVFQPFFVDLDLPVALTQGDEVWIPVAVYNYLEVEQKVRLELAQDDWFELLGEATKEKLMAPGEVDFVRFHLKAVSLGSHMLTVKAYGTDAGDAVSRMVNIVPDGREHVDTYSDRLTDEAVRTVEFPAHAVEGANGLLLRVLPGVMSQVVEGLQSIFRMPFGCFEQTSSITYPNVMVLDYMRETGNVSPELEMTAEEYINLGYQRLLAYEVEGGGFEWFGNPPANLMLSAYGLMEFHDMSRVYEIDARILQRTADWILSNQHEDGHWAPDPEFLHGESWGKIQRSEILPTAYAAWALQQAGYGGEQTRAALEYVERNLKKVDDPYALALCANALTEADRASEGSQRAVGRLVDTVTEHGDEAFWQSEIPTFAGARKDAADIETTALALMALLKHGEHSALAEKVLTHLVRSRDSGGTWHTTQGTVLVLQALLKSLETSGRREATGALRVWVDDRVGGSVELTEENREVVEVLDLTPLVDQQSHVVRVSFQGEGECAFDLVTTHYVPWSLEPPAPEPVLEIETSFDKTELEERDLVTQTVRVMNRADRPAKMVLIDLGLPPGFSPQTPDLEALVVGKTIQKYELTGRQVIVYLERLNEKEEVSFSYRLKARFPMRASSGVCRVYEYYTPEDVTVSHPVQLTVKEAS